MKKKIIDSATWMFWLLLEILIMYVVFVVTGENLFSLVIIYVIHQYISIKYIKNINLYTLVGYEVLGNVGDKTLNKLDEHDDKFYSIQYDIDSIKSMLEMIQDRINN